MLALPPQFSMRNLMTEFTNQFEWHLVWYLNSFQLHYQLYTEDVLLKVP